MIKSKPISDKRLQIALHALGWFFVIAIPIYFFSTFSDRNPDRFYSFYVRTFLTGAIFYLGYLWLVPKFFLQDKKLAYFVILAALILSTHFINEFVNHSLFFDPEGEKRFTEGMQKITGNDKFRPPMKAFGFYNHLIVSTLVSGFAIGLGVLDKLKQNETRHKELEKEKLNSELAFLKNQVSPHFFFNTLNNIYSLIDLDTTVARDSVLKLSKLMRYLLYESEHGKSPLSHEISFMNNYIDLMRLRLTSKVELIVHFPTDFNNIEIEPLLFIPFIENAFKHGISYRERSFIAIDMKVNPTAIHFNCRNTIGRSSQTGDGQHTGIGLENVRKRLALLFPLKHTLEIVDDGQIFTVNLTIQV